MRVCFLFLEGELTDDNTDLIKDRPFFCLHCSVVLVGERLYRRHMRNEHPDSKADKLFACTECSHVEIGAERYRAHFDLHSEPSAVKCRSCPFLASSAELLQGHDSQRCLGQISQDLIALVILSARKLDDQATSLAAKKAGKSSITLRDAGQGKRFLSFLLVYLC